jgi:hypothetical protein
VKQASVTVPNGRGESGPNGKLKFLTLDGVFLLLGGEAEELVRGNDLLDVVDVVDVVVGE